MRTALFVLSTALFFFCTCLLSVHGAVTLDPPKRLTRQFYKKAGTCKDLEAIVFNQVKSFYKRDRSITPKLLRLLYSDCFVSGCDASILLVGPDSEQTAPQNRGLGGMKFIDTIKKVVEAECPKKVSCADILHLATRDALHLAGAPSYPVLTGRRDGLTSTAASVDIPSPDISVKEAVKYFQDRGLDELDFSTLMGGHSIGSTHCSYIRDRLYNFKGTKKPDPDIKDASILDDLRSKCPPKTKQGQHDPLVFLNPDSASKFNFTSSYYSRVLKKQAVLGIDQQLLYGGDYIRENVEQFATDFENFRKAWALSITRMGSYKVLTGKAGEIREYCNRTNTAKPI